MKVMVVDDDRSWREIHQMVLTEAGFEVTTFSSLRSARSASAGFERFVIDGSIDAPDDGITWAKELTSQGKKVVVCSGRNVPSGLKSVGKGNYKPRRIARLLR
ncbi:response regulator [candidate division WWE3 bacterium]|nr:response regulator [candidate division WWE3 bacterium]